MDSRQQQPRAICEYSLGHEATDRRDSKKKKRKPVFVRKCVHVNGRPCSKPRVVFAFKSLNQRDHLRFAACCSSSSSVPTVKFVLYSAAIKRWRRPNSSVALERHKIDFHQSLDTICFSFFVSIKREQPRQEEEEKHTQHTRFARSLAQRAREKASTHARIPCCLLPPHPPPFLQPPLFSIGN